MSLRDEPIQVIECKPRVYLIGRQHIDEAELSRFLADEGVAGWSTDTEVGGERLVEVAGRTCYMSFAKPRPGGNAAYTRHILETGHGSVLEHAVFNLLITGVDRSFSHELVRHRAGTGFSQLSQRFVDETGCRFIIHPGLEPLAHFYARYNNAEKPDEELTPAQVDAAAAFAEWLLALEGIVKAYDTVAKALEPFATADVRTLKLKQCREAARSILPNCTETKVFLTGNVRALRNIIEQRGAEGADRQIRLVARELLDVLRREAPNLFGDYVVTEAETIETPYRKV